MGLAEVSSDAVSALPDHRSVNWSHSGEGSQKTSCKERRYSVSKRIFHKFGVTIVWKPEHVRVIQDIVPKFYVD